MGVPMEFLKSNDNAQSGAAGGSQDDSSTVQVNNQNNDMNNKQIQNSEETSLMNSEYAEYHSVFK